MGDRDRECLRLLRALRRGELDPDLPANGEGLHVPGIQPRLDALRGAAMPGTISAAGCPHSGSRARRAPATILFMALTLVAVIVYGSTRVPCGSIRRVDRDWVFHLRSDHADRVACARLVPKSAAGTAAGFTGFFGYAFGSAIAGNRRRLGRGPLGLGRGHSSPWSAAACSRLVFSAITLGHKAHSAGTRPLKHINVTPRASPLKSSAGPALHDLSHVRISSSCVPCASTVPAS